MSENSPVVVVVLIHGWVLGESRNGRVVVLGRRQWHSRFDWNKTVRSLGGGGAASRAGTFKDAAPEERMSSCIKVIALKEAFGALWHFSIIPSCVPLVERAPSITKYFYSLARFWSGSCENWIAKPTGRRSTSTMDRRIERLRSTERSVLRQDKIVWRFRRNYINYLNVNQNK